MAAHASNDERRRNRRSRGPRGTQGSESTSPRHIAVIFDAFVITKVRIETDSQAKGTYTGSTFSEVRALSLKDIYEPKVLKLSIVLSSEGCTSLFMDVAKQGNLPLEQVSIKLIEKNLPQIISTFYKLVEAMGILANGQSIDKSTAKTPSVYLLKEELGKTLLSILTFSKPVHIRIIECIDMRKKLSDDEVESLRSIPWENPALSHTLYKGDKYKKVKFLFESDKSKIRPAIVTSFFTGTEKWHEPLRDFCTMMLKLIDQVPVKSQISNKTLHQAILENTREIQELKKHLVALDQKVVAKNDQNLEILGLLQLMSESHEPK